MDSSASRNTLVVTTVKRTQAVRPITITLVLMLVVTVHAPARMDAAGPAVLVLHDSGGPSGFVGAEYSLMLKNLLGHFGAAVTVKPVTTYTAGQMGSFAATFYVGSTHEEPSYYAVGSAQRAAYGAFLQDAATTTRPVVWLNYNLWNLAWNWSPAWGAEGFAGKFGFTFDAIQNAGYNRVLYKGVELFKGVVPHANPGAALTTCTAEGDGKYACSTEVNLVSVVGAQATVYATTHSTLAQSSETPYITRGGNFWFVGDIPFSYHSEEDRYLAFADLLHDMLGIDHPEQHLALVRLEDVSADNDTAELAAVSDFLTANNIKFSVAAIPIFKDPLGVSGTPGTRVLAGSAVGLQLQQFYGEGRADMIQHGTTHQWDNALNAYNKLSGDDFEFYRVTENPDRSLTYVGPLPGDTASGAKRRINDGKARLLEAGLTAFAWEAPHYTASSVDYKAIRAVYPTHYGRLIYFSPTAPAGRFVGQFYPYFIQADDYGYQVIPENLGNIEPDPTPGYRALFPADLIRHAEKAKVVRDGAASFFFHPYLPVSYLQDTVLGIQNLGYLFVAPCVVNGSCP